MKVAYAVAQFLREKGIEHVFCISGGASLWFIHGINDTEGIDYVCPQTEQAAGFAADSYARIRGLGCAVATSGPGATNLITAVAASFYDSIPVLYLTGNVTRNRMTGDSGVRQTGFQETPISKICGPITKFARTIKTPEEVFPMLEYACNEARINRPGPVLVDIPDDIQRHEMP